MKPFDLEEAKKGAPVCTRDGHSARIICWDVKDSTYPIIALVNNDDNEVDISVTERGSYYEDNQRTSQYDLFMAEEEYEEEHYDISNFKPFDKVLVRDSDEGYWKVNMYSHFGKRIRYPFETLYGFYNQCIPCNEETVHLIGTTNMPLKKYINW